MTVGIAFTNGIESVAVADSRVSDELRHSDSFNKLGSFQHKNYEGVLFGTGSANLFAGVLQELPTLKGESLDEFVESIRKAHAARVDALDNNTLASAKNDITKRSAVIPDNKRKGFVRTEIGRLFQEYNQAKDRNQTRFVVVAYDKQSQKARQFYINESGPMESFASHIEVGSGTDGANLFFATRLHGVDSTSLALPQLAFFATNAYALSTLNQGVGGTPKIAHVSKEGTKIYSADRVRALTNLSGAYLAEGAEEPLSAIQAIKHFQDILTNPSPNYATVAKLLSLNTDALTTTAIPYGVWQERANAKLFGKK